MLDFRHETFLTLCRIRNYTKTAEELFITQPAVSQHIKFLEELYGGKLFRYQGKVLTLTPRGEKLLAFTETLRADSNHLKELLCSEDNAVQKLEFGATLTIGEFICPKILERVLTECHGIHITMQVENTHNLIQKLRSGNLKFLIVEGFFDKSQYGYQTFSKEKLTAVCSSHHQFSQKQVSLHHLLKERIILRETGSGTRDIFEQGLYEHNLSVKSFSEVCEVGNLNAIKHLTAQNFGITFIYHAAVKEELEKGVLKEIFIDDFNIQHEFSFVYLKNTLHRQEYEEWFRYFAQAYSAADKM